MFFKDNAFFFFHKGTILGAFYYGYTAMQIPGGWLGQRFGGTRVFGICLGIASILTMLTPIAARTSVAALITLRVIEGLALVGSLTNFLDFNKPFAFQTPILPFSKFCQLQDSHMK